RACDGCLWGETGAVDLLFALDARAWKVGAATCSLSARYAAPLANVIGSITEGSSFSGLLTRVEIGQIRIKSAGNGRIRSRGSSEQARRSHASCSDRYRHIRQEPRVDH